MERTRWWYALVGIAVVNVLWSLVGVLSGERITVGPATVWVLFGRSLLLLTPVFYYSLYHETRSVRKSANQWAPEPRLWVGGGVVFSLAGSLLFLNPMTHYVAGLYVLQRFRKLTPASPVYTTD